MSKKCTVVEIWSHPKLCLWVRREVCKGEGQYACAFSQMHQFISHFFKVLNIIPVHLHAINEFIGYGGEIRGIQHLFTHFQWWEEWTSLHTQQMSPSYQSSMHFTGSNVLTCAKSSVLLFQAATFCSQVKAGQAFTVLCRTLTKHGDRFPSAHKLT